MLALITALVVAVGGIGAWKYIFRSRSTDVEDWKINDAAPVTLATLPDGHFRPDGLKVSFRELGKYSTDVATRIVATSPDQERIAIVRRFGNVALVMPVDVPISAEMPASIPTGLFYDEMRDWHNLEAMFSPDSKHLAWRGSLGAESHVAVLDGKPGPAYQNIYSLAFSPDSNHFAYVATMPDHKHCVVKDNQQGPVFDEIVTPHDHSPQCVVMDGTPQQSHAFIVPTSLKFSPDGSRFVYIASEAESGQGFPCYIVDNGTSGKHYNWIVPESLSLGSDGGSLAFRAFTGTMGTGFRSPWGEGTGSPVVVLNGKEQPGSDEAIFSDDCKHEAHRVTTPNIPSGVRTTPVIDGVPGKQVIGGILHFQFSKDGKHYAFLVSAEPPESDFAVIDGIELKPEPIKFLTFHYARADTIRGLVYATDGMRLVELKLMDAR